MHSYKIVASDLDGTLLNGESKVSEINLRAIAALDEKGVFFVPATGRNYSELLDELKSNDHIRFLILSNGAVVYDKKTGEHICNYMQDSVARRVFELVYEYDVHVAARHDGKTFIAPLKEGDAEHYRFSDAHKNVLENYAYTVNDLSAWLHSVSGIEVFSVHFASSDEYERCAARVSCLDGLKIAKFPPVAIEIFGEGAGKGNALRLLADKLGVDYADTIAVGDSQNDYTMIKAAGLGLGVSNATDALKEICDEIICSNEEHAIDYINRHFFDASERNKV